MMQKTLQDGRETSRSQEMLILFRKNLLLQIEQGDQLKQKKFKHVHLKTTRVSMLSRLMIDQGDLAKTQLQFKTTVQACHEAGTPNIDDETHRENREDMDFKFQDYHIPLWRMRRVPAFDNWFRKLRTTQIDMFFNKIHDRINHLIFSIQSQKKWFGMWVTSKFVNCSRRNPKRNAQHVYHTGTLASSLAKRNGGEQKKHHGSPLGTQHWSNGETCENSEWSIYSWNESQN